MDSLQAQFGTNLRALREARGLTQEALAAAAGMDRSYVGGVERGERNPSLTAIGQLAVALEVSLSSLFVEPTGARVSVAEKDGNLTVGFRYDQYDAEYVLDGAHRAQYENVLHILKHGLASDRSIADAVADSYLKATALWPDANPSDLWTSSSIDSTAIQRITLKTGQG